MQQAEPEVVETVVAGSERRVSATTGRPAVGEPEGVAGETGPGKGDQCRWRPHRLVPALVQLDQIDQHVELPAGRRSRFGAHEHVDPGERGLVVGFGSNRLDVGRSLPYQAEAEVPGVQMDG